MTYLPTQTYLPSQTPSLKGSYLPAALQIDNQDFNTKGFRGYLPNHCKNYELIRTNVCASGEVAFSFLWNWCLVVQSHKYRTHMLIWWVDDQGPSKAKPKGEKPDSDNIMWALWLRCYWSLNYPWPFKLCKQQNPLSVWVTCFADHVTYARQSCNTVHTFTISLNPYNLAGMLLSQAYMWEMLS